MPALVSVCAACIAAVVMRGELDSAEVPANGRPCGRPMRADHADRFSARKTAKGSAPAERLLKKP